MTDPTALGMPPGYTVTDEIGSGGAGTVYRARRDATGGFVALKIWNTGLDDVARGRFEREVSLLRKLRDEPHIVPMLDAGVLEDGRAWMATVLYDESLAQRITRRAIPVGTAFTLADDVLAGLQAVHQADHLHRDVKPANVMLDDGRARLGDFGLALPYRDVTDHTAAGSPDHIAPELLQDLAPQPTVSTDIYAAGTTVMMIFGDAAPERVQQLLDRACSERIMDRPRNVASFRHALAALNSQAQGASSPPVPAEETVRAPRGRRRGRLVAVGGGVMASVAVLAAVGVMLWLKTAPDDQTAIGSPLAAQTGTAPPAEPTVATTGTSTATPRGRSTGGAGVRQPGVVVRSAGGPDVGVSASGGGSGSGHSRPTRTPPVASSKTPAFADSGTITTSSSQVRSCAYFSGTSRLNKGRSLILALTNRSNPDAGTYVQVVHRYDDPQKLPRWEGAQYFNGGAVGQRLRVTLMSVNRAALIAADDDDNVDPMAARGIPLSYVEVTRVEGDAPNACEER